MATEAQKRASIAYDKTHTKGFYIKLNINTDSDVIAVLESVPNRQGYIKELIRADLAKNSEKI